MHSDNHSISTQPIKKATLFTLFSTFENLNDHWGLEDSIDFRISKTMHDLYMEDFPSSWADASLRKQLAIIGPNDYFTKWESNEFSYFEDTPLAHLLDKVEPQYIEGSRLEGKITGLPLFGGNHQLMFINRSLTDVVPSTFDELIKETWRLRNSNVLLYPFVYPTNACYFAFPLLYSTGSPLWGDPEEPELGITWQSLYDVLMLHKELMYDHSLLPVKWEQYHSVFEFQTRRAAFCFGGDWDIKSHLEVLGEDLIVAPIPSIDRESRSTASCNYLYLSHEFETSRLPSIESLVEKLLSIEIQTELMNKLYRNPVINDVKAEFDNTNLNISHRVYEQSIVLPPTKWVSHIFHVLADLFEPGVMVKYPLGELTDQAIEKMQDTESQINLR